MIPPCLCSTFLIRQHFPLGNYPRFVTSTRLFSGHCYPPAAGPCLTHISRKQAGTPSETASLRREVGGSSAETGEPFFRGDLCELGHGGRVTVSSEGRPHGRAVCFFSGATGTHLPIRQVACHVSLLQDAMREQIGSKAGQRAEGSRRLRPLEGKSRLPGRAVAGPSVSRDRTGRRRGRCTAWAWQASSRPPLFPGAWRGAGASPVSLPPLRSCRVTLSTVVPVSF